MLAMILFCNGFMLGTLEAVNYPCTFIMSKQLLYHNLGLFRIENISYSHIAPLYEISNTNFHYGNISDIKFRTGDGV